MGDDDDASIHPLPDRPQTPERRPKPNLLCRVGRGGPSKTRRQMHGKHRGERIYSVLHECIDADGKDITGLEVEYATDQPPKPH